MSTSTSRRRTVSRQRPSAALTLAMTLMLLYTALPLVWLLISATKTNGDLLSTFGLGFGNEFALWDNLGELVTRNDGEYVRWFGNTVLYAAVGGVGATCLATLGGYGLAKFDFPGRRLAFGAVIAAMAVPVTALAVPTFLFFAQLGIVNTRWSVIIPALASPLGLYLMVVYARQAVPDSLLEAARLDGAGELRTFVSVVLRLLAPGFVTVLLFNLVATWNNYFLPLIMLSDSRLYPLTIGLNHWSVQARQSGQTGPVYNLIITGSVVMIVPLLITFLFLQRYWQSGLAAGAVKQ